MSMFDMIVTPDDGEPIEIEANMRDVRMWEKTHRGRALASHLGENMKAEYLFELAFSACRRQRLIPAELTEESFIETHEIELEEPGARARRHAARAFRAEIVGATSTPPVIVDEAEDGGDEGGPDPTRPGVSPGQ